MATSLIDSHTHIYGEEFDLDREAMLQRADEAGVGQMVLPCVDRESYERMLPLVVAHPLRLFPCIGLHPTSVKEDYQAELTYMREQLELHRPTAVGEIGLDFYWDRTYEAEQVAAFREQLQWAARLDLPVILHIREAFSKAFEILRAVNLPELHGVFHSFTGSSEELEEALSFERFAIGINGVVTFKNSSLKDYVTRVPLGRLLLETDAPYLAPTPNRGKRNEPSFLPHTAQFLASLYGLSYDQLTEVTSQNARRLFRLPTR